MKKIGVEIKNSSDTHKLRAAISLLVAMLPDRNCLILLVHSLVGSPLPSIRHTAASSLYISIVEDDGKEDAADWLALIDWSEDLGDSGAVEKLCELLDIPAPVISKENNEVSKPRQAKQSSVPDYVDLVKEAHW